MPTAGLGRFLYAQAAECRKVRLALRHPASQGFSMMMVPDAATAEDFARAFNVPRETLDRLCVLHDLLLKWNRSVNLTTSPGKPRSGVDTSPIRRSFGRCAHPVRARGRTWAQAAASRG